LAEMMRPALPEWAVRDERDTIIEAAEHASVCPADKVYGTSFGYNGIGRSIYGKYNLPHLTNTDLKNFVEERFVGNNIAVVGVGVNHEEFAKQVADNFGYLPKGEARKSGASKFTGGVAYAPSRSGSAISVAYGGAGLKNEAESLNLHVLQRILGGGNPKATPGQFRTSRLSQSTNNGNNASAKKTMSFFNVNSDSSLLAVHLSGSSGNVSSFVSDFKKVTENLASKGPNADEVERAKNQVNMEFHTQISSGKSAINFLGKQALFGESKSTDLLENFGDSLGKVTPSTVHKTAVAVFGSTPGVVVSGNVDGFSVDRLL